MELEELLLKLTPNQIQFVRERLAVTSDAEAARRVGLTPNATYNWDNRELVKQAIKLAQADVIKFALVRLKQGAAQAIDVILDEMQNPRGNSNRLRAATEVLDRVGLPRGLDFTTGGESFVLSKQERDDSMAKFAEVLRAEVLGKLDGGWDVVDAEIETPMAGITESSG